MTSPTGAWHGEAFAHEAFFYDEDAQAVTRCVPFVLEAFDRGEDVIVVVGERVRQALAEALGGDVARIAVLDVPGRWCEGGFGALQAYDRDVQGQLSGDRRPWRLVVEPTWLTLPGGRVWSRFEAVVNDCYGALPYYSLCLHDSRTMGADLIDAVLQTHPLTWDGSAPTTSVGYLPTADYLRSVEPEWTPRPASARTVPVISARRAREVVTEVAQAHGANGRTDDMVVAVNELVANALRAAGQAELSAWTAGPTLVWEVADNGPGLHDVTAGYVPPHDDLESGRGLWLARSLADDATVRPHGPGTAIRLYFDRHDVAKAGSAPAMAHGLP